MNIIYEIEWRELLLKRLLSAQAVLKRDAAAEEKRLSDARQLTAGFKDLADAHEAYGWCDITEAQFNTIRELFENPEKENKANDALKRLGIMISYLRDDIHVFKRDTEDVQDTVIARSEQKCSMTDS